MASISTHVIRLLCKEKYFLIRSLYIFFSDLQYFLREICLFYCLCRKQILKNNNMEFLTSLKYEKWRSWRNDCTVTILQMSDYVYLMLHTRLDCPSWIWFFIDLKNWFWLLHFVIYQSQLLGLHLELNPQNLSVTVFKRARKVDNISIKTHEYLHHTFMRRF